MYINIFMCLYAQLELFLVYNMHMFSILCQSKAFKCHAYTASSKWGRCSSPHLFPFLLSLEAQVLRVFLGALTIEDKGTQYLLAQPGFLYQSPHQASAVVS